MPKTGSNIYNQYEDKHLFEAITHVKMGKLSLRKASAKFGVPRSTISDHVTGRIQPGATPGKQPAIPRQIEASMVTRALKAADMGFGLSRRQMMSKAGKLCSALRIKTPFRDGVPGQGWWEGLKSRHPELVLRKPEKLSTCRSRAMNRPVVEHYFKDLNSIIETLGLFDKPKQIWNADETGLRLEHDPINVVARKGSKNLPGRTSNNRESVSVLACVNANGETIPPMVIVRGETARSLGAYDTAQGPPGTSWTYQKKAYMEEGLGLEWFKHHFLQHVGPQRPQLIIWDRHSSHEGLELLQAAKEENIHMVSLPPHTTHMLQPLDKTVFGPLSKAYRRVCSEYMSSNPSNMVSKWVWPGLFRQAYESAFTSHNIKSGFRSTGICPLNPNAVSEEAYAPCIPFNTPVFATTTAQPATPVAPPTATTPVAPPTATTPVAPPTATPVAPPTASVTVETPFIAITPVAPPTATTPVAPPTATPVAPPTASVTVETPFIAITPVAPSTASATDDVPFIATTLLAPPTATTPFAPPNVTTPIAPSTASATKKAHFIAPAYVAPPTYKRFQPPFAGVALQAATASNLLIPRIVNATTFSTGLNNNFSDSTSVPPHDFSTLYATSTASTFSANATAPSTDLTSSTLPPQSTPSVPSSSSLEFSHDEIMHAMTDSLFELPPPPEKKKNQKQ